MRLFQHIIFIALVSVSAFFTLNLALGLGTTPAEKAALVAGSLALEGLKAFALVAANTASRRRQWGRSLGCYLVYVLVGAYSLVACLGFALATVDHMEASTRVLDHSSSIAAERATAANCADQIKILRTEIGQRQSALASMDPVKQAAQVAQARRAIGKSLAKIDGYDDRRMVALDRADALRDQDRAARAGVRRSLYDIIGEALGVPGSRVAFAILAVFSLAIEVGIFLTSPHAAARPSGAAQGEQRRKATGNPPRPINRILDLVGSSPSVQQPTRALHHVRRSCRSPTAVGPSTG